MPQPNQPEAHSPSFSVSISCSVSSRNPPALTHSALPLLTRPSFSFPMRFVTSTIILLVYIYNTGTKATHVKQEPDNAAQLAFSEKKTKVFTVASKVWPPPHMLPLPTDHSALESHTQTPAVVFVQMWQGWLPHALHFPLTTQAQKDLLWAPQQFSIPFRIMFPILPNGCSFNQKFKVWGKFRA